MEPLSTLPVPGPAGCEKGEKRRQDYTWGWVRWGNTGPWRFAPVAGNGLQGTATFLLGKPPSSPPAGSCSHLLSILSFMLRLSLSSTQAGETGPGASRKAQPWLFTSIHLGTTVLCMQRHGSHLHISHPQPPAPHPPAPPPSHRDARARCHSAQWPVPICSQTRALQGLIHHSAPINKTWARAAAANPPKGCTVVICLSIRVEESFAFVCVAPHTW